MSEQLGEAVLVLRTDDSQLDRGIDLAKGKAQRLGSEFQSTAGTVANSSKTVGAAASEMAARAQRASQAAVGMAGGASKAAGAMNSLGSATHLSSLQIRESLVLMREASAGNFTRMAGSASILAGSLATTRTSIGGLVQSLLIMANVLKVTKDAELELAAADAAAAAASVGLAVTRAAANIAAADTKLALAEAQLRTATTAEAEALAQAELAAAHLAVAAAAREAEIAELALAAAQGRATQAAAAAAATTTIALGPMAAVFAGLALAAGLLVGSFKSMQAQVRNDHTFEDFANSLGLTKKEMKELRQEVGGLSSQEMKSLDERAKAFELTWGDVFHGLGKTASDALDLSATWQAFTEGYQSAFAAALGHAINFAASAYGHVVGAYRTIVQTWEGLPAAFGSAFASAVNVAIDALNNLVKKGTDLLNGFIDQANKLPFVNIGHAAFVPVERMAAQSGQKAGKSFGENVAEATAEAQAQIAKNVAVVWDNIIGAGEKRIKDGADAIVEDRTPKKDRKPKKQSDHGLADALATLDAQIEGQRRLADAYQISDAAVMKAEALQKAEEQAIKHKGLIGIFYEKELAVAVAKRAAEGAKTLSDLAFETAARKRVNDAVAAGTMTASEANQAMELEGTLRPLVAAAAVAEGKAKQKILDIIQKLTAATAANNGELSREAMLRELASNDNDLDKLRLEASLLGASNRERAVAVAQLEAMQKLREMPGLSPQEQQAFIQSYIAKASAAIQTPFQQWAATVPQTAAAINESLQSIMFQGFDSLGSAITDVIMGTKSLGAAFKDVAQSIISQIIQMTIRMMIFRAISGMFGGGGAGAGEGAAFGNGDLSDGTSSLYGNLFSGFGASGGLIPSGTFGVVGEKGPEPVIATPRGAMVLPNKALRGGAAGGFGQPSVVELHVTRGEMFDVTIGRIAGAVSVQVVDAKTPQIIGKAANATMKAVGKRGLP